MKKTLCTLLAAVLLLPLCFTAVAASGLELPEVPIYDVNFTETVTDVNVPYVTGGVYVYTNDTNAEKAFDSITYHFSSALLFVFAKDGRLIEAGSSLLEKKGCVQEAINVPAGGFAVAFPSAKTNLKNCWDHAMEGAMLYNATLAVVRQVYGTFDSSAKKLNVRYNKPKAPSATAKKYLFVGNSTTYVNGNPLKFRALCEAAGLEVTVEYCTKGSSYLYQWADETDECGKKLRGLLNKNKYDFVVLQDASGAGKDSSLKAVAKLVPLIKANGATPLFYMRYPDKLPGTSQFKEQVARFNDVYSTLAETYGTKVAPVVNAYARCAEKYPEINLYADDAQHHSKAGSYLIAATWLYAFTGKDPVGNTYTADLPADTVKKLQEIAKNAVEVPYVEGDDGSGIPNFVASDGTIYKPISVGKDYTRTGTPYKDKYEDSDGKGGYLGKMTDGKFALAGDSDAAIGCFKGAKTTVTVDLGEVMAVKAMLTDLWGCSGWGIGDPASANVTVACSVDGETWSSETKLTYKELSVEGGWKKSNFSGELDAFTDARYVRFTFNISGNFCWVSETVVYGSKKEIKPKFKPGDINGDNTLDAFDYQMVKAGVLGSYKPSAEELARMDVNGDTAVDAFDYQMVNAGVRGTYIWVY